jgi:hypothetical protein
MADVVVDGAWCVSQGLEVNDKRADLFDDDGGIAVVGRPGHSTVGHEKTLEMHGRSTSLTDPMLTVSSTFRNIPVLCRRLRR